MRWTVDSYTTVKDVAAQLSVSIPLVHKLMKLGELESLKVGRCVRIPTASVDRYVARHTRPERASEQAADAPQGVAEQPRHAPEPMPKTGSQTTRRRRGDAAYRFVPPPGTPPV
jgi:excisionase family DNA binding protein